MTTIVMTGGSSGFGEIALRKLKKLDNTQIFLGAHSKYPKDVETIPLDLSSMESVNSFASEVITRIGIGKIDVLIFNAGLQTQGGTKTPNGIETTFAVNHLSHYLLLRLFMPKLANSARIILTTSGTYDPAEKTIIPPPLHANAKILAYPEFDKNLDKDPVIAGGRAYSSSKLCIMLTVRYLAKSQEAINNKWIVTAYDPGATPGTNLVRNNQNPFIKFLWKFLGSPMVIPLLPKMNSQKSSGETLADLAMGNIEIPDNCVYIALRKWKITYPKLSELAQRNDLMEAMWNDSASLIGLT